MYLALEVENFVEFINVKMVVNYELKNGLKNVNFENFGREIIKFGVLEPICKIIIKSKNTNGSLAKRLNRH